MRVQCDSIHIPVAAVVVISASWPELLATSLVILESSYVSGRDMGLAAAPKGAPHMGR